MMKKEIIGSSRTPGEKNPDTMVIGDYRSIMDLN